MLFKFTVEKLNKSRKKVKTKKLLKLTLTLFVWFFVIGTILFLSYFIYLQRALPDPETIVTRKVGESTKIYDRTGETLLYDIHGEEKRTVIPWEDIPDYIKKATLSSEDSDFYNHRGVDFRGIARAFLTNLKDVEISQGGSTITQQLIKKALLGDERTVGRKIKELILTIEIERRFSKDELFWMYLNQIPYGSNAYGIEAASKTFFNKPAKALTLNEAAIIASLPKAPTYYSPYGSHVDELMIRKDSTLKRMADLGYITPEEYNNAKTEKAAFQADTDKISAPHFVIMVKEYLVSKYGEDAVEKNGLRVITTLDPELQTAAEEAVTKYSVINKEKYKANNAAMAAINPKTGEVLALVGSSDYFDIENEGNFNVATAKRQPGSAFKPFAYAVAFRTGYPDGTIVFDVKTEFNPECSPEGTMEKDKFGLDCYHPENYDGRFRGPVTLRNALAQSLNVPSVKTLYLANIENTINLAESMGITTLQDRSRFGLSLVLGGAEVKLIDLVSAYGVFGNDGLKNQWFIIKRVESATGEVLEESKPEPKRVLESSVARLVNDILSDNNARAPVFGYSNPLHLPGREVAAKTGTTQENRDAWVVGYTPSLAVGVWTGNNDNKSMTQAGAGISASGPMWNEFMARAIEKFPVEGFNKPDPVFSNKIMLNGRYVSDQNPNLVQDIHNILYYIDTKNPLGPIPLDPTINPQFKNWEWTVLNYFKLPQ
ncbi:MAG: transglycosylase domain-containing protein [Candidatus Taylorbacteria bacterium]|nr:transglycosylase domain-containing protein [Candidatus Taylorbacteria bacterium]